MHSSLLITDDQTRVIIDYGIDWAGRRRRSKPDAILLTHGHPDHAGGLKHGFPCPVFATGETWKIIERYPIVERRTIAASEPFRIGNLRFEAFPVVHSVRAPAVGFQVRHGRVRLFYAPDVLSIMDQSAALAGVCVYIGDGASIIRPIIRKKGSAFIGHASIASQLGWCQEEGVPRAIFTHCGSQIVAGDEAAAEARVRELGRQAGIDATLAHDGLEIVL